MKKELTTTINVKVFGVKEDHGNVNKFCKAVIINFGDERGDIIVENDNFGTRRKYADFTFGKRKAGLHPMQIVFSGIDMAKITATGTLINTETSKHSKLKGYDNLGGADMQKHRTYKLNLNKFGRFMLCLASAIGMTYIWVEILLGLAGM